MKLRVGLVGGGSWGTTVGSIIARNAPALLWARNAETVHEINSRHTNERYLPGARLGKALRATASIQECVDSADVVVMGVPSHGMRDILQEIRPHLRAWVPVISLAKGLEPATGLRMSQVIEAELPGHPVGVLTGPNLAAEILAGFAAASVIAMEDETIVRELQRLFMSGMFRVYTNTDVIGCELGGTLKNVMAIAVGMGDSLGAGDNTRAGVITRALAEMTRLGVAMGGRPETFAGLAGMGDLIATCTSPKSRNRHVGLELGKGRKIEDVLASMGQVAEGVKTCKVVADLAREYQVEMSIAREVYEVVYEGKAPQKAFRGLLRRDIGSEANPG
jgi:glycerol-3-phosphate dehydrogenase (NAD(P)+)